MIELPKPCLSITAAAVHNGELPAEFASIGHYMTLSLCTWAFASCLWSIFFEPDVPCNFAGAWVGPIAAVLEPIMEENDLELLSKVLSFTKAAPLWLGVALCGQKGISKAILPTLVDLWDFYGRPDTDGSAWTGITQSFMDIARCGPFIVDGKVSRADVWRLRHDCHNEYLDDAFLHTPPYGWPPFGHMQPEDVELEIRHHLTCSHSWKYKHWTWLPSGMTDDGFLKDSNDATDAPHLPKGDFGQASKSMNLVSPSETATKAVFWWCCEQVEKGFGGTIVPRRFGPDTPTKPNRVSSIDSEGIQMVGDLGTQ